MTTIVWDQSRPSMAVVSSDGDGHGIVLWHVGYHLQSEIGQFGRQLRELGLDSAPSGISVWEGTIEWGHNDNGDIHEVTGAFRRPTEDEWDEIEDNRCPWNEADWHKKVDPIDNLDVPNVWLDKDIAELPLPRLEMRCKVESKFRCVWTLRLWKRTISGVQTTLLGYTNVTGDVQHSKDTRGPRILGADLRMDVLTLNIPGFVIDGMGNIHAVDLRSELESGDLSLGVIGEMKRRGLA